MKPLVLALSALCLALAAAACSGDEPRSAGPVPSVPIETEPADGQAAPAGNRPAGPRDSKRIGFIGLPPEGATPSTPERGELVIPFFGGLPAKIIWTDRDWGVGQAWLYADGRLIWVREDDRPYGANHISTGLLEQRLTPDGVELFRSELLATGVFRDQLSYGGYPTVRVRDGDRFLNHRKLSPSDQRKFAALFADPASWLPGSAWADSEIRAYVPSRFAVCYWVPGQPSELSRILSLLPASAQDLLHARMSEL